MIFDRSSVRRQTAPVISTHALVPLRVQAAHCRLEAPTAVTLPAPLLSEVTQLLKKALLHSKLHLLVSTEELTELYVRLCYFELQAEQLVFAEGFPGSVLYIVHSGRVSISSNQVHTQTISAGECFGGLAPCFGCTRMASAYTVSVTKMWTMSLIDLRTLEHKAKARLLPTLSPALETAPWMQCLSPRKRQVLLDACLLLRFTPGQKLLVQGARSSLVLLLASGQVQISQDSKNIRTLGPGEVLGEQSVLYTGVCTATVSALTEVHCLAVDKSHLQIIFSLSLCHFIYRNSIRIAMDRSPTISALPLNQKEALLPQVKIQTYAYDEVAICEGTAFNEGLWLVLQGSLVAKDRLQEEESYVLEEFSCINDDILLENGEDQGTFTHDVMSHTEEAAVGFLSLSTLREIVGSLRFPPNAEAERIRADLPFLQSFSRNQIEMLCRLAESRKFEAGEELPASLHTSTLCLLRKGKVLLSQTKQLTAPSHFGCGSSNHTTPQTQVIALQSVRCLLLSKTNFHSIFHQFSQASVESWLDSQHSPGHLLSDFTILRRYEKLRTGSMFLVTDSEGREFGLKRICRKKVKSLFMSTKLRNEKTILTQLEHPLINKLIRAFRDTHHVYFLKEFVPGVMLSDVLPRLGRLQEEEARDCVAMVLWTLEHIHSLGVLHRDINPESFVVDMKGYLRLVDVGCAHMGEQAVSVAGSPHYVAPEVLQGQGYGFAADLWSLGVMTFELLHGRVPFADSEEDPFLIFEAVMREPLPSIDASLSASCQSFLCTLLDSNPDKRSCVAQVKQLPWLQDYPWTEMMSFRLHPVFHLRLNGSGVINSNSRLRRHYPFEGDQTPTSPARRPRRSVTMSTDWSYEF